MGISRFGDIKSLDESIQTLLFEAKEMGVKICLMLQYPETDTSVETTVLMGNVESDFLTDAAIASVKTEITTAVEWLTALPKIQTMVLKAVEEAGKLTHHSTQDIIVPNLLGGDLEHGIGMVAIYSSQGEEVGVFDCAFSDGELYVPFLYREVSQDTILLDSDGKLETAIQWEGISTGDILDVNEFNSR